MAEAYDVLVIGGGIVGAACAHELGRAGLRVGIVEQRGIGTGATSAGMGHLVALDDSAAQLALSRYSLKLWGELADELPEDCEYRRCGTLWVAADEDELRLAREKRGRYASAGVAAAVLDERQVSEAEPNLRRGLAGGLLVPGDAAVHPASAARFLVKRSGAEVIAKGAKEVRDGEARLSDGSVVTAGAVVNAAGTAAAGLTPELSIRSRKGHIATAEPGAGFASHQVVELGYVKSTHAEEGDSVVFNVRQNRNGELLIGSSRQYGREGEIEDAQVEPGMIERLFARAAEYMPALAEARPLRRWAGFRAGTPDGLPLIGRCPGYKNVFAAAGHEGLGATTSLGTGRLIADWILGRASEIERAPYEPARLSVPVSPDTIGGA
ncbi:MAG: FAD-binding oxidoreductase [Acidobacteriaceae bacterium]|nr:FAD-binding oxidoreductase [Acidobacteriaceae bacterium]